MPYRLICTGFGLLILSELIRHSSTFYHWDFVVVKWMSHYRIPLLNALATLFSQLGVMFFIFFMSLLWCLQQARQKKYALALFISLGVIGSSVIGWLLKWWIARPRPQEMYHLVNSYGDSFPSIHSIYAATLASLAILVFRQHRYRTYIIGLAIFWLVLMGISRVYAGVHYPSDVLAGWSIGFIWISLLWLWLRPGSLGKK